MFSEILFKKILYHKIKATIFIIYLIFCQSYDIFLFLKKGVFINFQIL
jgi:hypothetical protein